MTAKRAVAMTERQPFEVWGGDQPVDCGRPPRCQYTSSSPGHSRSALGRETPCRRTCRGTRSRPRGPPGIILATSTPLETDGSDPGPCIQLLIVASQVPTFLANRSCSGVVLLIVNLPSEQRDSQSPIVVSELTTHLSSKFSAQKSSPAGHGSADVEPLVMKGRRSPVVMKGRR